MELCGGGRMFVYAASADLPTFLIAKSPRLFAALRCPALPSLLYVTLRCSIFGWRRLYLAGWLAVPGWCRLCLAGWL